MLSAVPAALPKEGASQVCRARAALELSENLRKLLVGDTAGPYKAAVGAMASAAKADIAAAAMREPQPEGPAALAGGSAAPAAQAHAALAADQTGAAAGRGGGGGGGEGGMGGEDPPLKFKECC